MICTNTKLLHPESVMLNSEVAAPLAQYHMVLEEEIKRVEVARVLERLAEANIIPLIYKGTALAYRDFEFAYERERLDTDILIPKNIRNKTFEIFSSLGYQVVLTSDTEHISHQQAFIYFDKFDIQHVFDVHWHISNREIFKNLYSYSELLERSEFVPRISASALVFSRIDSLIIACVHPVMHHHNCEDSTWTRDIVILAKKMTENEWSEFIEITINKNMAAIILRGLRLAIQSDQNSVPADIMSLIESRLKDEPSAVFLQKNLTDSQIMKIDFRSLPNLSAKFNFIVSTLLPKKSYMLRKYNLEQSYLRVFWPVLYLHRLISGIAKRF